MKAKLNWLWYWHVYRRIRKFVPWLARKLPMRLKYYVVIDGMVKVEPNLEPTKVSGMQLLDYFAGKDMVNAK